MDDLNLLIIEDEAAIVRVLEPTLAANVGSARFAWSGTDGIKLAKSSSFDLIICDLGLPDMDGHDVIQAIRAASAVPIIVLSARGNEEERIRALDAGADDFVSKPFAIGELLARIRAVGRRHRQGSRRNDTLKVNGYDLDLTRRRIVMEDVEVRLSGKEHSLLRLLAERGGEVVTHKEIIEAVWGHSSAVETQFVRVLVGQLRQKIEEDPSRPRLVCTEPGLGYRLGSSG